MVVSDKEIARRIGAIKEGMIEKGLQALIVFSQVVLGEKGAVRYISGYRLLTRKDYLILPLAGDPVLIVPTFGQQISAMKASWIKDVRSGGETEGMIREVANKIKTDKLEKGAIGIVGLLSSMPHHDYELLKKELPEATFTDSTTLLDGIRAVKSPEEIEMVRATTDIADMCYELLLETIRPGIDEREVMAEINKLLTLKGVEDTLILTSKGRSFPCFIAPPGPYVFQDGDHYVFSIEISGPSGYWSQIVRPLCLGKPSLEYQRMFEAGGKALERGVAELVPGKRVGDVVRIVYDEIKKAGFNTGLWCGHGMGMDLGDGMGLFENNHLELKDGMVITVHPHIMSQDGKEGLLLGDTFVVREGGAENLSRTVCELKCLQ
jgi:Xaa-Pro aminopeptidase